jgi:hypothetical protein
MGKHKGIKCLIVCLVTLAMLMGISGCVTNSPPIIYSLTPSASSLGPGASCTVSCSASDPNGDTLIYAWSVSGGAITGAGSTVTWTAPLTEGNYTITASISDGRGGSDSESCTVAVFNTPPSIASLTPSASSVIPGGSCTIDCSADDADEDTLSYAWSATGGAITGAGSIVTWTAPATEGSYIISVTVSDSKGGSDSESCAITVESVFGSINVNSNPTGARIYLDGVYTGNITPFVITNVAPGPHTVSLELYLYNTEEGQVTVTADETAYINWPLTLATIEYLTIQLGDTNGQDSFVRNDLPTANYGTEVYLTAGSNPAGLSRAFIQFDLTELAADSVLIDATLALNYYDTNPALAGLIGVYQVLADWDEATVTWNSQPTSSTVLQAALNLPFPFTAGFVYWTITDLVQGWCDGSIPNYGLMVADAEESTLEAWKLFRSSEDPSPSPHPQLIIVYYDPTP